ncbi:hypothetical protein LDG_8756 [Legionella drancourtii LLAP12]|uniref:2'-5' RNA ligase n=2 Tax=Legionella drancourtii TaxID=168933 RepID=G9ETX0_9GAMM|nr:hypothetical protein LDG_8756 [Legionella drancourtii LLAP12]
MASNQSINVYLKLKPDNQVSELIKEFNQFLEQQKIFTEYQITPYIDKHPLHVTLYMANYQETQIPQIIKHTEALAKQQKQVSLLTSRFIPSGGYVMLSVTNDPQIQGLSNKALNALSSLRNKKALIPAWAAQDIDRQLIFTQYGSPNVLNYFNPHFSVFAAEHLHPDDNARLQKQLQLLVSQFAKNHQTQVRTNAYAIGVGIADSQGQIVKELKSFSLE